MNTDARWPKYFLMLLSVSAFGPYVLKDTGVRLEHFVLYPVFGLATLLFVFRMSRYRIERDLFVFTGFWTLILGWITWISLGVGGESLASLSTFENFLQPLAIMLTVVVFAHYYRISDFFESVVKAFLVGMAFNSVLILLQLLIEPTLFGVLEFFVRGEGGESVAERAATVGRYLGIYDQPLEAGANYSLAVLGWAYLEKVQRNIARGFMKYILLTLIILGGIVTISKVFIIGGLFLFLIYIFFHSRRKTRRTFLATLPVLGGIVAYYLITTVWRGLQYLARYFEFSTSGDQSLLAKYTSGRFGSEDSVVREVFSMVYNESFIYGFGLHDPPILDNGFSEMFYHGGLIGLIIYSCLMIWLLYKGWEMYKHRHPNWVFFGFMAILVLGLNIGGPGFTLNRFSVNITLFMSMMFLMQRDRMRPDAEIHGLEDSPAGEGGEDPGSEAGPAPAAGRDTNHPHHR